MQTDLLTNIQVEDLKEVNVANAEVLTTLLAVLDVAGDEISGKKIYDFLGIAEKNQYQLAGQGEERTSRTLLALSNIYLYLIEESDWLIKLPENEVALERKRVEDICRRMRACAEAADLLSENNADTYINRFLTKVQKTGYIHRKEKTCQIVLDLLRMDEQYFSYIPVLVDIVLMRQCEEWLVSDLRGQLVILLQEFIAYKTDILKNLVSPDSKQEQEQIAQVIKAIALQLKLYKKDDAIDFSYNRALLYHFASFVPTANAEVLLKNAYYCLIESTSDYPLEYGWSSISSVGVVASILSTPKEPLRKIHKAFSNDEQIVDVSEKNIIISPDGLEESQKRKSIPSTIAMWNKLQVEVESPPSTKVTQSTTDLKKFNLWWKEIEKDLFLSRKQKSVSVSKKKKPAIGDYVWIVVDGIISAPDLSFHATIRDDDKYEGDGIISIKEDIVGYDPRSVNASFFLNNGFRDPKTGMPYIFEAIVEGYVGSMLHFSMARLIEDDWCNSSLTNYGNELNAVVTFRLDTSGQCIAISEEGPTIQFVDINGNVSQGDHVRTRVTGVKKTKNHGLQLTGDYVSHTTVEVTQPLAIAKLLQDYSKGEIYKEEEVELVGQKEQVEKISQENIAQMIRIIDRQAYLSKNIVDRYLLLCVAGTLSRIIDDQVQVDYYRHCCAQQITLQEFGKNNAINLENLHKLDDIPEEMISMFPLLHLRRQELHALNALGKPDDKDKILFILETTDNAELKKLCNLVLAYNFLSEFKMDEEKKAIIDNISELMNIKLDIQETEYLGNENEITEFKSSLIFIANAEHKVIADPQSQLHVILKEINAFLNTKGGKLYIGVNNLGYAVGVSDDIEWLRQNQNSCGNVTDMDTYQQYLTNAIYKAWPNINTLVQVTQPNFSGRNVVVVEVSPSSSPLSLEGSYYYRVGTETRMVTKEGEKEFLKRRPAQYESLKQ